MIAPESVNQTFLTIYKTQLLKAVTEYPSEYMLLPGETAQAYVDRAYPRMVYAMTKGTYGKDGRAIKATCRILGIKHTYQAINAILKGAK